MPGMVEEVRGRQDGGPGEPAPQVNTLTVQENGPLELRAPTSVAGSDAGPSLALCRCGASRNKPYCDGSHVAAGFTATGEPPTRESEPLASRAGPVAIQPVRNGPLHLKGPLEIVSGTGRTIDRVQECWLCRCGGSARKPYCDGAHKRLGFTADGIVR
jgi:CDGSH-type Zn-finger protein